MSEHDERGWVPGPIEKGGQVPVGQEAELLPPTGGFNTVAPEGSEQGTPMPSAEDE